MATELGVAYLSLAASSGTFAKDVRRELGGVESDARKSGAAAGRKLGGGLSKGLKVVGGAIAGVTALVGGLIAKGGIDRALAIEGAEKKLEGLGHSAASISAIMDNALASVRGTAYGLGDAATVAASLSASGVKAGAELEGVLKTVADTAAISGRSLTDVGTIFGSVAARGKLQGDDMLQLMSAGVPVLQFVGKQIGKTSAEVSQMVSKGQVDFATFAAAMQANLGGAALKSGETFTGAWSNVRAALGRLGAAGAVPGLDILKGVFNDIIPVIDAVTAKIGPLAQTLADRIGPVVSDVTAKVGDFVTGLVSGETPLGGFTALLSPVGSLLKGLGPALAVLGESLVSVGSVIGTALLPVIPVVVTALTPLVPLIGQVVQAVVPLLPPLIGLAQQVFPVLAQVVLAVVRALSPMLPIVASLVTSLLPPLGDILLVVVQALSPLIPAVVTLVQAFMPLLTVLGDLVAQVLPPVVSLLTTIIGVVASLVGPLIDALSPALQLVADLLTELAPILGIVAEAQGRLLAAIIPVVAWLVDKLAVAIKAVVDWLIRAAPVIARFVVDGVRRLGEFARSVGEKIGDAVQWFRDLPGRIAAAVVGFGSLLVSAGQDLVRGLIDGVRNMASNAVQAVKDVGSSMLSGVKNLLGIASPSRVFRKIGAWVTKGLALGVLDSRKDAVSAIEKVSKLVTATGEKWIKAGGKRLSAARTAQLRDAQAAFAAQARTATALWRKGGTRGANILTDSLTAYGNVRRGAPAAVRGATLADVAKARENVADRLEKAQARLKTLQKDWHTLRDSVYSAIRGELDLSQGIGEATTDRNGYTVAGKTTFASVSGVVRSMAAKAKTFAGKLQALVKAGIPAGLVQEVASLGTEQGTAVANALLSGSKSQRKALAVDYASLEKWSGKAGTFVADQMYRAGLDAQRGLIAGLEADDAKLQAAAKRLASRLTKAVKKELGIRSPSRVFDREVGRMLPAGIIRGFDAMQGTLDRRTSELVDPVLANANPDAGMGAQGTSAGRSITDADIAALASVLQRVQLFAELRDDRTAARIVQRGSQAAGRLA